MFGDHFYHERTRKCVAIFGSLFNNLRVIRTSGGTTVSQLKVPLAYAPQRKFLERISEMYQGEDNERQLAIKLPRMSFEIVNMAYDAQRQLPKMNYFQKQGLEDQTKGHKWYVATPYIVSFELSVYAKTNDDALQIVEQILPYFAPQYTVAHKPIEDFPDIVEDVPLILTATTFSDDFEGPLEGNRTIVYTLAFDMKINFYGPKPPESNLIKRLDMDFWNMEPEYYLETVRLTQDSANGPIDKEVIDLEGQDAFYNPNLIINYQTIFADSEFTYDLRTNDVFDSGTATYMLLDSDVYGPSESELILSEDGILTMVGTSPGIDTAKYSITNPRTNEVIGTSTIQVETTFNALRTEGDETQFDAIVTQGSTDSDIVYIEI